eukprot:1141934-Pelagomonas_calceolata.AAC.2
MGTAYVHKHGSTKVYEREHIRLMGKLGLHSAYKNTISVGQQVQHAVVSNTASPHGMNNCPLKSFLGAASGSCLFLFPFLQQPRGLSCLCPCNGGGRTLSMYRAFETMLLIDSSVSDALVLNAAEVRWCAQTSKCVHNADRGNGQSVPWPGRRSTHGICFKGAAPALGMTSELQCSQVLFTSIGRGLRILLLLATKRKTALRGLVPPAIQETEDVTG